MTVSLEALPSWLGYATTALVALGAWWNSHRKTDIDESALVLGKWKELVDQHQTDIRGIREEFAVYKKTALEEIGALRLRIVELESENRSLRDEVAGLKRAIAQNSQSTAMMLGGTRPIAPDMADELAKLDRAGHNWRKQP